MSAPERAPAALAVSAEGGRLRLVWRGRTLVDGPFLFAGRGRESIDMYRGNFDVRDYIEERLPLAALSVRREEYPTEGGAVAERYRIELGAGGLSLGFHAAEEEGRLVLGFPEAPAGRNRFWFRLAAEAEEHVYGCGEQFSHFDLRGRRFPLWTSEQGVGRNKSTLVTFQADVQDRAGGDYWWTFYPEPTYVSSRRYLLHAETSAYAAFDFRHEDFHELEFWALPARLVFAAGETMREVVQAASALLGRQPEPPDWIHDGVVLGIQGGTRVCLEKLEKARAKGVRVAGIWAQDWEGIRMTSFGKRLMWNWVWDRELYPGLEGVIAELRRQGLRFLGYINPYLAAGKSLFLEAEAAGYLALDREGRTYLVDFGEFEAGIVDFTKPEAAAWYRKLIRENLIALGLSGWMADFGEYLPTDLVLADGSPPMLAHNAWPALWARVCREAVEEAGALDEVSFFMRAGYSGSQRWSPMMWAGDQNVDWSEDDGLPSVIPAALSLAVCGHGVHHTDIGGYTTLFGMRRDRELFMRWAELAAFTAMMRSHEGNRPGDNWQFDSDEATLEHLARMSRLFAALKPYRRDMLALNAREGLPLQRPLFLAFEEDPASWTIKDEFLFGDGMLVAPVIRPGAVSRPVHLPPGRWVHGWSGRDYGPGDHEIEAPLGEPPAFIAADSPRRAELLAAFEAAVRG